MRRVSTGWCRIRVGFFITGAGGDEYAGVRLLAFVAAARVWICCCVGVLGKEIEEGGSGGQVKRWENLG